MTTSPISQHLPIVLDNRAPAHNKCSNKTVLVALTAISATALAATGIAGIILGSLPLIITGLVLAVATIALSVFTYRSCNVTAKPQQPIKTQSSPTPASPTPASPTQASPIQTSKTEQQIVTPPAKPVNTPPEQTSKPEPKPTTNEPPVIAKPVVKVPSSEELRTYLMTAINSLVSLSSLLTANGIEINPEYKGVQSVQWITAEISRLKAPHEAPLDAYNLGTWEKVLDLLEKMRESLFMSNPDWITRNRQVSETLSYRQAIEKIIPSVAQGLYNLGQRDRALKIIALMILDDKTREDFYAMAANDYYHKLGQKKEALKINAKIIHNDGVREDFYAMAANDYYHNLKQKEKALKINAKIIHKDGVREDFYAMAANDYFTAGKLDEALATIKKIIHKDTVLEEFLAKLRDRYVSLKDLGKAKEINKLIISNDKLRITFTN